jgi:hypothetical protein
MSLLRFAPVLCVALVFLAPGLPPVEAHKTGPGQVLTQGIAVTEVGYFFGAPVPGVPFPVLTDDYVAIVQEAGHGIQINGYALGAAALPQKTAPRPNDPVWGHMECTIQDAPVVAVWTVNIRDALTGAIVVSTTSPGSAHGPAAPNGNFVDTWPILVGGAPVGTAWVKYTVGFWIPGGSIC